MVSVGAPVGGLQDYIRREGNDVDGESMRLDNWWDEGMALGSVVEPLHQAQTKTIK